MKANAVCTGPIRLECDALEEVEVFIYLASVVNIQGGTDADVKACISKARTVFLQLKNIWISRELCLQTKIKLLNSNAKFVLLYGSETVINMKKVQSFINTCLRRILQIYWTTTISNSNLWQRANT